MTLVMVLYSTIFFDVCSVRHLCTWPGSSTCPGSTTALRRSPSTSGRTSLISAAEKANMMYVSRNTYCTYDVDIEYDDTLGKAPERY
jgi:hypothetical protein